MRANPEDQLGARGSARGVPIVAVQVAVAFLVAAGLIWFWFDQAPGKDIAGDSPPSTEVIRPMPEEVTPAPDVPRRPVAEPVVAVPSDIPLDPQQTSPEPLDGDAQLRDIFSRSGADARLLGFLSDQRPLEISAALIDGMSWGAMLRKILPASPPKQAFSVDTRGDQLFISASSYARYDVYADSIEALDVDLLVDGFHRLRPLYEATYEKLGLDPEDFDNAVIRTLDRVLSTPEIDQPIALEHKSVFYQFEDPMLEALPDLQKQMLRMGPENMRRIKVKARELREKLLKN
ncbi:MAG: DUF3014 domain-containing protein [Halioglobus sp.]